MENSIKLSPAEYVVHVFGSQSAVGKAIGRNQATIFRWLRSKRQGGVGGLVPHVAQQQVLKVAQRKGLDIRPEDLVVGREVSFVSREKSGKRHKS